MDPAGFDQNTVRESGNADGIRDLTKRQCGFQENADGIQDLTAARKARFRKI